MNPIVEQVIVDTINKADAELRRISLEIHDSPELGEHEYKAYKLLTEFIKERGFKVTRGVAGMPTAFIAEFSNSSTGRRLGFCSEYDALPGIGHACGHNLIAISGLACALATKALLEQNLIHGTVILYGTPAEESTNGKIRFVNAGEVDGRVDFAMMLHPGVGDGIWSKILALDTVTVEFFGKASHAGATPWEGINALDAFMQGWNNVSMLRQQTLTTNRIHGIVKHGGNSANVIPDYASGEFYCRGLTHDDLADLKTKVENCFKAAAGATGCKLKLTWDPYGPIDDVFVNDSLGETYKAYMLEEGGKFLPRSTEETLVSGTTDFGNFTRVVPGLHPGFYIGTTSAAHTIEYTEAARTEEAHKLTLRAARALTKTAATVFLDEDLYTRVRADFEKGK